MLSFELFVGFRYLRAKQKRAFISLITFISIGGVSLGVMVLITVLAVMNGFEKDMRNKILGTMAHITIFKQREENFNEYPEVISRISKTSHVVALTPFVLAQAMLQSSSGSMEGVVVRGIDAVQESAVTQIKKNLIEGNLNLEDNGILIGIELAYKLGLKLGDKILIISKVVQTPMGLMPRSTEFKVVGIFQTGMYEYDTALSYISLKMAQKLYGMGNSITGIEVKLDDIFKAEKISTLLQNELRYPYWVRSWVDMNRNLFSALKLEKITLSIILTFIVLVSAFNIVSTLIMVVMEKTCDIGILKAIGATQKSIANIFLLEGFIIGVIGTAIGTIGGVLLSWALDKYQFIKLPGDVYYIDTLPVEMRFLDILLIGIAAITISSLAALYPAWQASRLDPVEALRYE
ncbi:MAG: lipoprotein-releasing ABC transporter permease subunit [Candidatus Firestonebacteria bacterium]|nr:lipoprotein-releasing ABC transporter permease subunit [Candidatus Firestonebacteria bacterium]